MSDKTIWEMIDDRMTALKPWHTRMDETRKLAYLEEYELKNFQDQKMKNVIHVTGNKAAVFGNAIITDLQRTQFQTVIEGDVSKRDAANIEQFINDNLGQADDYILQRYGLVGLLEWLSNHVCIRGPIGAEWYPWIDGKEYNIHCLPLDMRWSPFQYGNKGLKWVAPISWRSSDDLLNELEDVEGADTAKIPKDRLELEVRDFWDGKTNELWVERQKIYERPNPLKKPPFVIVFPPSGFMLRDKGYMEHEAEDIFYLIRGLNEEVNRTLSIEQSLIFNVLRPGYEQEVEDMTADPAQPVPKTGEVIKVKKGELHKPVPTGDMNRANLTAREDIFRMIDEGAPIAPRMYTQPPSGAELLAEMEALARLQNSRIIALKVFREQLSRMMIEFYRTIAKDGSYSIGKVGKKSSYSAVQLKDPDKYTISCRSMTKNKRQELANLAMFNAAYDRLPLQYNLENVLQAEDPDGIIRALDIERAKKADPAIDMIEMAIRYVEEADDTEDERTSDKLRIEAKMLTERGVALIQERKQPAPIPDEARIPQVRQPTREQTPLLGGMGVPPAMPKEAL